MEITKQYHIESLTIAKRMTAENFAILKELHDTLTPDLIFRESLNPKSDIRSKLLQVMGEEFLGGYKIKTFIRILKETIELAQKELTKESTLKYDEIFENKRYVSIIKSLALVGSSFIDKNTSIAELKITDKMILDFATKIPFDDLERYLKAYPNTHTKELSELMKKFRNLLSGCVAIYTFMQSHPRVGEIKKQIESTFTDAEEKKIWFDPGVQAIATNLCNGLYNLNRKNFEIEIVGANFLKLEDLFLELAPSSKK